MPSPWALPSRYVTQEARSACGREAVEQQELRRNSSAKALIATPTPASGPNSGRISSRRSSENRLFNNAQISPVLDSEHSKSMSRLPIHSPSEYERSRLEASPPRAAGIELRVMMSKSMSRLPIASMPATSESSPKSSERSCSSVRAPVARLTSAPSTAGKDSASKSFQVSRLESSPSSRATMRQVSAPNAAEAAAKSAKLREDKEKEVLLKKIRNLSDRLSQDRSPASIPNSARDSCTTTPRVRLKSHCPNIEGLLAQKDTDAMQQWYTNVEAPLEYAFLDARCPYRWLDFERHQSTSDLEGSWTFADFKKEWDHQDSSQFEAWCEAMTTRTEKVCCDGASSTGSQALSARPRARDENQVLEATAFPLQVSDGRKIKIEALDDAKRSARSPLKISEAASPQRNGLQAWRQPKRHQLHAY